MEYEATHYHPENEYFYEAYYVVEDGDVIAYQIVGKSWKAATDGDCFPEIEALQKFIKEQAEEMLKEAAE